MNARARPVVLRDWFAARHWKLAGGLPSRAQRFCAPNLTGLAKPPTGTNDGFVEADLGSADTVIKSAYSIQMESTPFGGAPDTCNALGTGATGQAFRAGADPLDVGNNVRYFAINAGNAIWEDRSSLWATMPEAGDPPSGFTLK